MKVYLCLIVVSFFSFSFTWANCSNIDSLKIRTKINNLNQSIGKQQDSDIAQKSLIICRDYKCIKDYDKAKVYCTNALNLWKKLEKKEERLLQNKINLIKCSNELGEIYSEMGFVEKAIKNHKFALKVLLGDINREIDQLQRNEFAIRIVNNELFNMWTSTSKRTLTYYSFLYQTYSYLAEVYFKRGEYQKAIQNHNEALNKSHVINNQDDMITLYNYYGKKYKDVALLHQAAIFYEEALKLRSKQHHEFHRSTVEFYFKLGEIFYQTKNYNKAESNLVKAYKILYKTKNQKKGTLFADINMQLGLTYGTIKYYQQAEEYLHSALKIYQNKKAQNKIIEIYLALGTINKAIGDFGKAKQNFDNALNLCDDNSKSIEVYYQLGLMYKTLSDYKKAIEYFEKARKIRPNYHNISEVKTVVSVYDNLGDIYNKIENDDLAKEKYETQIKKCKILSSKINAKTQFYKNLRIQFDKKGLYNLAKQYKVAEKNYKRLFDEVQVLKATSNFKIAGIYYLKKDFDQAIRHYNKTNNIYETLQKYTFKKADIYSNISKCYYQLDSFDESIWFLEKALKIYRKKTQSYRIINTFKELALACKEKGDFYLAHQYFNNALKKLSDKNDIHKATLLYEIGELYSKECKDELAKTSIEQAISIFEKHLGTTNFKTVTAKVSLAKLQEKSGNLKDARMTWISVISNTDKLIERDFLTLPDYKRNSKLSQFKSIYDEFYCFFTKYPNFKNANLAVNTILRSKAISLAHDLSIKKIIYESGDSSLINSYNKLQKLNIEFENAEKKDDKTRKKDGLNLLSIRNKQDKLVDTIFRNSNIKEKLYVSKVKWKYIQKKLPKNEVFLEFFTFKDRHSIEQYYVLLIEDDNSNPSFIRLTNEVKLDSILSDDRQKKLNDIIWRKELYGTIWKPILSYIDDSITIHYSLTGKLHQVDIHELQVSSSKYLIDKYNTHQYLSARDFIRQKIEQDSIIGAALIGGLCFYDSCRLEIFRNNEDNYPYLPESLQEVKKIDTIYVNISVNTKVIIESFATFHEIKTTLENKDFSHIHFSTHGHSEIADKSNPLANVGIVLSGGNILSGTEIAALNLSHLKLVVLPICNSAKGPIDDTEGVFSLVRAFKKAGAGKILACLQPVEDKIAAKLMILFYKNLIEKNQVASIALQNAKKSLIEEGYNSSDWAGFILVE